MFVLKNSINLKSSIVVYFTLLISSNVIASIVNNSFNLFINMDIKFYLIFIVFYYNPHKSTSFKRRCGLEI